ncbi:MAG: cupin domain-containing protein [Thiohalocapsa sp.]
MYPELSFPKGIDAARFMADFWQQKPLLMRQALPALHTPVDADDLAGLACEPDVESRLIRQQGPRGRWQVDHGPFDASDFASLPERDWTLLVQDVDKMLPDVAALLERFNFLPDWRLDDIMISFAADGGSVGPHVDAYDVFLIQTEGHRRWRIDTRAGAPADCIPDLDLRILRRFDPDKNWLLNPGDLLYLPPGIPHWGIAEGSCVTWSVGLQAPTWHDLASGWFERVAEQLAEAGRWRDPGLGIALEPAELPANVVRRMRARLDQTLLHLDTEAFSIWLGETLTEPKENLILEPIEPPLHQADLLNLLRDQGGLRRDGRSRLLFQRGDGPARGADLLFANGTTLRLPAGNTGFLSLLCKRTTLSETALTPWLERPACASLLRSLINAGHFRTWDSDPGTADSGDNRDQEALDAEPRQ